MTDVWSLKKLLLNKFEIPPYQRDYSWEKEHVQDFWNDACACMDNGDTSYYIGPMVFVKDEKDDSILKVVDGQQRLTTVFILLSVIRDIGSITTNDTIKERMRCMIEQDTVGKEPKLTLNDNNDIIFKTSIIKLGNPEEKAYKKKLSKYEKNLFKTYQVLFEEIKKRFLGSEKNKFTDNHKDLTDDIANFVIEILQKFKIFNITLDSDEEASQLFGTLNERGLSLSIADLIKNYLFVKSNKSNRKTYQKIWQEIIEKLGQNIKLDKFIHHHFIAWEKNVQQQKLYSNLTSKMKNDQDVSDYLESLFEYSKNYSIIMSTDKNKNSNIHLHELFDTLGNDSAQPLILNAIQRWGLDSDEVKNISKYSLDIHFRARTIGRRSAKEMVDTFASAAKTVKEKTSQVKDVKNILSQIDFHDNDFRGMIMNSDFSVKNAKYFLKKINRHKTNVNTPGTNVDDKISVEHIMPRNINAEGWEEMASIHDELLDKIGNLTLLQTELNSEEQDKPFEHKKIAYQNSGIDITKVIGEKPKWDENDIKNQSEIYAIESTSIWVSLLE